MRLRPATWDDRQILLAWRNDPVTIRSIPDARPTLPGEHDEWVQQRVAHPHFYIAEDAERRLGTVRLDPCMLLSITVAPEARGQGWATPMITEAVNHVDVPVLAQILLNNQASIRAFLKAGFRLEPGQWYKK